VEEGVDLEDKAVLRMIQQIASITVCTPCAEIVREEMRVKQQAGKMQEWAQLCPADFRNTTKLQLPSPTKLDVVMRWKYGSKGLILSGPSRRGKSRCAWKVVEREFLAGRECKAISYKFGIDFARKMSVSPGEAANWLDDMCKAEILLLDDVFKTKMTEAAEHAVFAIIGDRTERGLPMIITTNDTDQSLRHRLSADRAEPMMRRITEYCDSIPF
jgi:DNA replication protein DnaC